MLTWRLKYDLVKFTTDILGVCTEGDSGIPLVSFQTVNFTKGRVKPISKLPHLQGLFSDCWPLSPPTSMGGPRFFSHHTFFNQGAGMHVCYFNFLWGPKQERCLPFGTATWIIRSRNPTRSRASQCALWWEKNMCSAASKPPHTTILSLCSVYPSVSVAESCYRKKQCLSPKSLEDCSKDTPQWWFWSKVPSISQNTVLKEYRS